MSTTTLTKPEVIAILGKSRRTVDNYMADGRLKYHYVNGPNGKQSAFESADVERLKRDLEAPIEVERGERIERAVVANAPSVPAPSVRPAYDAINELVKFAAAPERVKPWLTLEEAEEFSGLTKRWLLQQAESGMTGVRDMGKNTRGGRWRFSRASLEAL